MEAVLKIIAYNPVQYATDLMNVFDFGVVVVSFVAKFLNLKGQVAMIFRVVPTTACSLIAITKMVCCGKN